MIVGIDPGVSGAIAFIGENKEILHIHDMPVSAKTSGKGNQVNAVFLYDILAGIDPLLTTVVIERVHAMPGQGVSSTFGFGRSLGVIEGIVASTGAKLVWVTPQKWKKKFSLIGKDKDASRTLAIEMYPQDKDYFKRKKDNGRSDALFIALSI